MLLQFENESDIPSGDKDSFVPFEQDGKQVFMHKDLAESKKTAFRHQGQLSTLTKDFETFKSGITVKQQEQESAAKLAQESALADQMTKLKADGKNSEAHTLEMQIAADKYKSLVDSNTKLKEEFTGLQTSLVETSNKNLAMKIAQEYVPLKIVGSFSKLLMMSYIKNVDGKSIFTNASGDAVDNDMARIFEVLNQDPELSELGKFPGSKGGYGGKGGSGEGDGKTISRRAFEELMPHERSAKMRAGIKVIN